MQGGCHRTARRRDFKAADSWPKKTGGPGEVPVFYQVPV
jgi:hypothetical protein